jgi:hypothetical protein
MIERDAIPEENQPHKSVFAIVENYINGINPYPDKKKKNVTVQDEPVVDASHTELHGDNFYPEKTHERDEFLDEEEKQPNKENYPSMI